MRRLLGGLALASTLGVLGGPTILRAAGAQDAPPPPAPMEGATIDDAGWWNAARPQVDLPTGQPPAPPVPGVPEGALVVGAAAGDANALTAIAIDPESLPGATVDTFTLTVRESTETGANLNSTTAEIDACPITEFWVGGENLVWETRPKFDCGAATVEGERSGDGTWTFDLTPIGQLWTDGTLDENGVALLESVEAPAGFRAVFDGLADQAIGVVYEESGGQEPPDPFGSGDGLAGGGTPSGATTGGSTSGGSSTGSLGGGFRVPTGGGPTVPATPPVTTPPTTAVPSDQSAADLPTVEIATNLGGPLATLPWTTIPLALIAIGVAFAAMIALGPAGLPVAGQAGRGVTRALARKELS